jgi:hypothetical protein
MDQGKILRHFAKAPGNLWPLKVRFLPLRAYAQLSSPYPYNTRHERSIDSGVFLLRPGDWKFIAMGYICTIPDYYPSGVVTFSFFMRLDNGEIG